ncbi:hypothetical protein [Lysobacter tyrosinilyticus]
MSLKKGIAVALVLAAGTAAAFLFRSELVDARAERQLRRQESAVPPATTTTVTRPAPIAAGLTIDGAVIDSAPMAGTLTLRVGNTVSTQAITISPGYSVVVSGAQGADMVSLEIATQSYRFASVLGSYAKLKRQAGSDGHLTATESDRVRVSPFSTSMYFFILRELGHLPVSDTEHEQVIRSLSGDDLATAAASLDDLAHGRAALPAGFANGYALLQNRQAFRAFINQQASYSRLNYLASAPSAPIRPAQLGRNMVLLGAIPFREVAMFNPGVRVLSQVTALDWTSYAATARRNPRFTASFLANGNFLLTAQGNASTDVWGNDELEHRQLLRETYRQLFLGERYSLWAVVTEWAATYPNSPSRPLTYGSDVQMYAVSSIDGVLPFRDGELSGGRSLPVFCKEETLPSKLNACEEALHHFDANGTGYSQNVGWKIDANGQRVSATGNQGFWWSSGRRGPLEMTYPGFAATFWRIDRANEAADTLVYVARSREGANSLSITGLTTSIKATLPNGFAELEPIGTWRYGSFDLYKPAYAYPESEQPIDVVFVRKADGTTDRNDLVNADPPEGPYQQVLRYGWQWSGGSLYETRYRANVGTGQPGVIGFSSCDQARLLGATACAPQQIRYFRPLAKVGSRLYGLQEVYQMLPVTYQPPYNWTRAVVPNYYQRQ